MFPIKDGFLVPIQDKELKAWLLTMKILPDSIGNTKTTLEVLNHSFYRINNQLENPSQFRSSPNTYISICKGSNGKKNE